MVVDNDTRRGSRGKREGDITTTMPLLSTVQRLVAESERNDDGEGEGRRRVFSSAGGVPGSCRTRLVSRENYVCMNVHIFCSPTYIPR